ncbi:MAG: hypothetical protein ACRC6T_11920 [Sarcina sp.]
MKKVFCMGLIGVVALSFVACGGGEKAKVLDDKKPVIEETTNKEVENEQGVLEVEDTENIDEEKQEVEKPKTEKPEVEEEVKPEVKKPKVEEEVKPEVEKPKVEKPKPEIEKPEIEKPKPEIEKPETGNEDKKESIFKLTYMDAALNNAVIADGEIKTVRLGVAENLRKITSTISSKYFDGLAINLTTIETIGSKKIAVVDLGGDEFAWNQRMQGSTGASITEHDLISNILQRGYEGYWVDGVRFTLNGKSIEDTGHIPNLARTTYR